MKLIVGLGNPGPEYDQSRHNVGFWVLDRLARRLAPGEIARNKFHGLLLEGRLDDEKLLLLKPTTYMNRSGLSVSEAMSFYKLSPPDMLMVIVDDVALPCGMIRVRARGSAGGHNGLDDINLRLGIDEYARLRIGIDDPGHIPQTDYVLGRFRPEQREALEPASVNPLDCARSRPRLPKATAAR